jgi:V/A-type H+-transporting ATPase subunit C
MSNLLKYPALNAKMKGMHAKNLSNEEIEELIKQNNLKEAISFLKSKFPNLENINENMSRRLLEQELNSLFITDILKLYKYLDKNENELFTQFILKYKIYCVKNVFRNVTTNKEVNASLKNIDNWTKKVFSSIDGINSISEEKEFLEFIKSEEYYKIFEEYEEIIENAPLEEIEVKLDKYYFCEIFKLSKKANHELEEMIGKEIDLLNIIWIYRSKNNFEYSPEQIQEILIPIQYKINKKIKNDLLNASDFEEIKSILSHTVYKNVFKDEENIERDKNKYLYDIYSKYFQTKMFNICTVFCYINLIDIEIRNIINVIEGIRYNIDRKQIQMRIIV